MKTVDRIPHDKHNAYNTSEKGRQRNATYSRTTGRVRSLEAYLSREFVAWDGEGGNEVDGSHTYFLLANSDGMSISERAGLGTDRVFQEFMRARQGVTHVGYGLSYDINMILRDLPRETLEELYKRGSCRWGFYKIEWRAGKSLRVATQGRSFLIYDVLPFFQRTFVSACDEYLGTDWPYRDEIIREKAKRGSFDWNDLGVISEYNKAELSTLVSLVCELRERLHKVEIRVGRWDGPGAIATALYKKYNTKSFLAPAPDAVAAAGRHAYAGGRFEIIRKGHSDRPAYQYDIRSAYPSAIRHLPCLQHGTWQHRMRPTRAVPFGVYRIEVVEPVTDSVTQPQPLWMRNRNGTVYFAEYAHGWYWTPETQLAIELGGVEIHEGWEWIQECECEPFNFVEGLYNKRAALKRAGDGAHVGLKLGLNSLYGKLAQQIGYDPGPPLRLPPYHSLEWAGYITSHCRAQVYRAAMQAPDDVIAFETDAVFSRVPLAIPLGDRLGQWEETIYSSMTYLKSGMYFATKDGEEIEKCRGINKGTMTRTQVIDAFAAEARGEDPVLEAAQTRFIGLGQALHQDYSKWRHWVTSPRNISVALNGKRIDLMDARDIHADKGDGWTETQEGMHDTEFSYPYEVQWIEKTAIRNPDGLDLNDVRMLDSHDVNDWLYE